MSALPEKSNFKLLGICACGAPCSRAGGKCQQCYRSGAEKRPTPTRSRKVYTHEQKQAALHLVRERGIQTASRRLGIPVGTLTDWRACIQTMAHSSFVQPADSSAERDLLLAQLIHKQQIEERFERRKYRHNRERVGGPSLDEEFEARPGSSLTRKDWVALDNGHRGLSLAQPHCVEWLDPTHDAVVEWMAPFERALGEAA